MIFFAILSAVLLLCLIFDGKETPDEKKKRRAAEWASVHNSPYQRQLREACEQLEKEGYKP